MDSISKLAENSLITGFESIIRKSETDDVLLLMAVLAGSVAYSLYTLFGNKPDKYHHLWFEKPQLMGDNSRKAATRDVGLKLEKSKKDVVIFWGSQSGTAEGFAGRLARDVKRKLGLEALTADLSDYDPESIANISTGKIAVFIISTYGDGDPSDNTTHFFSWLEGHKTINFPNLRYAAFGLGNKKYKFYNRIIDVVVDKLDSLQAKAIMPTGKADDSNGGTEEDFTEWKQNLFSMFTSQLGYEEIASKYEATLKVVEDSSLDVIDLHIGEPIQASPEVRALTNSSSTHPFSIVSARRLFVAQDRNCLHIELDITEYQEHKYKTGDHLSIWPSNPTSEVDRLINILGKQEASDIPLLISTLDPAIALNVPSPTSLKALFQYYLEICAPIGREDVLLLAQFAPSTSSQVILTKLGSDKESYNNFCLQNHNNLGRLLSNVVNSGEYWSSLPLSFVLEILSPLRPRYYSISSSSIVSPRCIAITVATSTVNSQNQPIPGLTTSYLLDFELSQNRISSSDPSYTAFDFNLAGPNNVLSNGRVFAGIRQSKFRLPMVASKPIVMIAAGSGIAPFRGFLQERARLAFLGREVGTSLLFFGCRSSQEYLYQDELTQLKDSSNGKIVVVTAMSREEGEEKRYVQDRLQEHEEQVLRLLLEEDGNLYICGSAKMARDVSVRLGGCVRASKEWGEDDLREWEGRMKKGKKWQEDVWH